VTDASRRESGASPRASALRRPYLLAAGVVLLVTPLLVYLAVRRGPAPPAVVTGVPECDDYLAKMDACLVKMEPGERDAARLDLKQKREQWTSAGAAPGPAKDALRGACAEELDRMPVSCGPIGIWACDVYLAKMEPCIARMDPAGRGPSEASFKQTREAWQAAKRSGANQELLQQACEAAVAAIPQTCK